jgi:hypothetical protein
MEQVSQWYKQHINVFLRVLAVALCLILNADVSSIVEGLWRDPTLRAALVAEAQAVSKSGGIGQPAAVDGQAQNATLTLQWQLAEVARLPLGWNCDEYNWIFNNGYQTTLTTPINVDELGWCTSITRPAADGRLETFYIIGGDFSPLNLVLKVLGLGVMSLGVSLGANFWYKLLKQLLSLRSDK